MHSGHTHHLGRLLAWISAAVLASGSIGFAAPAFAAQSDSGRGHSAFGHSHKKAHHPTGAAESKSRPNPTRGGNQGSSGVSLPRPNGFQAQSDPDGMTNGGVDQPGGTGGVDTTTQDGNNGSGNDVDCEDDNRGVGVPGHCKDHSAPVTPADDASADDALAGDEPADAPAAGQDVAGPVQLATGPADVAVLAPALFGPGTSAPAADAATAAGGLPNTGAGRALLGLSLAAMAALALGAALVRQGRRGRVTG